MTRLNAEKAAMQMIMSGHRHQTFEDERNSFAILFQLERENFIKGIKKIHNKGLFFRYLDTMGPTRMRSLQNTLICLITLVSRMAIDEGVEVEFSFALSDYYIIEIELAVNEEKLGKLLDVILLHYYDLVQNEKRRTYSKPIASAVRYIGRNLHDRCTVGEVAMYVGLEPHYFSTLFSKQVGVPPSKYIIQRKLEESKRLLSLLGSSVTETAESLGFCNASHFSRHFKEAYGFLPSEIKGRDMPRV